MKIDFINDIDYRLEAAYYLEKRLAKKQDHEKTIKSLIEYGVPREKANKLFSNYEKLLISLENEEIVIDPNLVPFLKAGEFNHSLASNLYLYVLDNGGKEFDTNSFFSDFIKSYYTDPEPVDLTINSIEDLIRLLNMTDFSNETKMICISFYYKGSEYYQELKELIGVTSRIIFKYNYLIKEEVLKNFSDAYQRIEDHVILKDLRNSERVVRVQPSIFAYSEMSVILGQKSNLLNYGFLFFILNDLKEESINEETLIINSLKALGDKTRFRIVSILQNKRLYLQELSRLVELTPATVSYHLDYLKRYNLIEIDEVSLEANKIYYRLNSTVFNKLIHYLSKLMEGN